MPSELLRIQREMLAEQHRRLFGRSGYHCPYSGRLLETLSKGHCFTRAIKLICPGGSRQRRFVDNLYYPECPNINASAQRFDEAIGRRLLRSADSTTPLGQDEMTGALHTVCAILFRYFGYAASSHLVYGRLYRALRQRLDGVMSPESSPELCVIGPTIPPSTARDHRNWFLPMVAYCKPISASFLCVNLPSLDSGVLWSIFIDNPDSAPGALYRLYDYIKNGSAPSHSTSGIESFNLFHQHTGVVRTHDIRTRKGYIPYIETLPERDPAFIDLCYSELLRFVMG